MRKLLTVVVLVALLLAGAFFLSEKVFKPQAQITGFEFLAVDNWDKHLLSWIFTTTVARLWLTPAARCSWDKRMNPK